MNMSTSDCSSGCESGWTMYLDQSSNSSYQFQREDYRDKRVNVVAVRPDDEDEDLSMVSDASSGPRQLNDDEDEEESYEHKGYFGYASEQRNANKQKKKIKEYRGKQSQRNSSYLDDTASSPIFNISKEDEASMEHGTSFKGKSAVKKHFGFLKTSSSGKAASDKSGGFLGRKRQ